MEHRDLHEAPLLIFANKQDLKEAQSAIDVKRALNLEKSNRDVFVQSISALDG